MKKVVCIFAHPDDEAFCSSGTIATYTKDHEVYVLCATKGESGKNHQPKKNKQLAEIRSSEMRRSAKILGVKKVYFLGMLDGTLSNNNYHELAEKVLKHLKRIRPEVLITFEPRGVSGHIDHVAVSLITSYAFERTPSAKKILQYCISEEMRAHTKNYFIFFPPGYKRSEVDLIVDISKVWDIKIAAIKAHKSQLEDMTRILGRLETAPREEYFLVVKK